MTRTYKINSNKNIGTVIFILEGSKTEFNILETIFVKLLGYEMIKLRRQSDGFVFKGKNPYSKVVALNFQGNYLYDMNEEELNELFFMMSAELKLKPENLPIYYIYDRDVKSYGIDQVRPYLEKFSDRYTNEDSSQGLLLLSYPAIEAFVVSCFKDNTYKDSVKTGHELKRSITNDFNQQNIKTDNELLHAARELELYLESIGAASYDIDDIKSTNLAVYDKQQEFFKRNKSFSLVSLFIIALIDLGIIEEA